MVLIHVKGIDNYRQFLYECSTKDSVDNIATEIIKIYNLRVTLSILCTEIEELIKYGPARDAQLRGLSAKIIEQTITNIADAAKFDERKDEELHDCDFDLDPTARRMGKPITNTQVIKTLNELIEKVRKYTDIARISLRNKGGLTKYDELKELMLQLKAGITIAYPQKLPTYDIIHQILFENILLEIADINYQKEVFDSKTGQLWFTSKKLKRCDKLNKYIGNNEKTKIIVKITNQKGQMPVREPPVNEEARKKMMAFWYKKQEQDKQLKADDDNSYLTSHWANSQALKQSYLGLKPNLSFK